MLRAKELILRGLAAGPRTLWDLAAEQNTQHGRFSAALRGLCDHRLIESDPTGVMRLTVAGREEAARRRLDGWSDQTCVQCGGRGILPRGAAMARLSEEFRLLCAGRPDITTEFDQGVVPVDVAVARVALLEQRGDLAEKNVLLLGDDDLMSLAFAVRGLAQHITVLEVDSRITAFLRQVVSRQGWGESVDIVDYDARDPLPARLRGSADVFFTDPVETVGGITLFLSRCCEALRGDGCAGYFGLTHLESGWGKWLAVERAAVQMNLVIGEILSDFNDYGFLGDAVLRGPMKIVRDSPVPLPPPDRYWYRSSLFRLLLVGEPRPLITGSVSWGRDLYADEETI